MADIAYALGTLFAIIGGILAVILVIFLFYSLFLWIYNQWKKLKENIQSPALRLFMQMIEIAFVIVFAVIWLILVCAKSSNKK